MEPDDLRDGGDQYSRFQPTTFIAGAPDQALTVQMQLQATGTTEPGVINVYFYASTDTVITASDYFLGRTDVWISGGSVLLTLHTTLPAKLPPGSYYVGWIIDPDKRFAEVDETNNTAYKSTPLLRIVGPSQSTIYVDARARGTNDGLSWKNALTSLSEALALATPGREIHVAAGVYRPDQGLGIARGDREASFRLSPGVTILGGYAGTGAPDPDARDMAAYATILSGDLNGDDRLITDPCDLWKEGSRTDNSRHVLTALDLGEPAVLDGVQVVGGYAFGPSAVPLTDDLQGAGLTMSGGSLILRHCTFSGNWAAGDGGAIYLDDGRLELAECTFRGNGAGTAVGQARGTGGAIRNDGKGTVTGSQCRFLSNCAGSQGGALDNNKGGVTLTRCLFLQNDAGSSGGGALWNSEGRIDLINCILHGNHSGYSGGAIANGWGGTLRAVNCCWHANSSAVQAGAIDNSFGGKATLYDCTLAYNQQGGGSGAIVCGSAQDPTNSELTLTNSILWNGGSQIINAGKALVNVRYCDVQGGWPGTGNLDVDPLFVLPKGLDGIAGTEDDNLRLATGSLCLDQGSAALLPMDFADLDGDGNLSESLPVDLDGNPRKAGTTVDLGAYEGAAGSCGG